MIKAWNQILVIQLDLWYALIAVGIRKFCGGKSCIWFCWKRRTEALVVRCVLQRTVNPEPMLHHFIFVSHCGASFAFIFVSYLIEAPQRPLIGCLTWQQTHLYVRAVSGSISLHDPSLSGVLLSCARTHTGTQIDRHPPLWRWIVWGRYRAGAARLSGRTSLTAVVMCAWVCISGHVRAK